MNNGLKVFLACAFGAFIGALVALQWTDQIGNIAAPCLGFVIGGIVGYFSYEIRNVVQSAREAWKRTTRWKPNRLRWLASAWMFFGAVCCATTFLLWALLATLLSNYFKPTTPNDTSVYSVVVVTVSCGFFFSIVLGLCSFGILQEEIPSEETLAQDCDFGRELARVGNPVFFSFWYMPKWILRGAWWLIKCIPFAIGFTLRFTRQFFILIHSDVRLLCGCDAALGAAIGFFAGSASLGAIVGGLLGVLNYELVSRRWLKLHLKTNTQETATT